MNNEKEQGNRVLRSVDPYFRSIQATWQDNLVVVVGIRAAVDRHWHCVGIDSRISDPVCADTLG